MQAHLAIEQRVQGRRGLAHVVQILALEHCQGVGARKVNQEQIVLRQVVPKAVFRQAPVAQPAHELVVDKGLPVVFAGIPEPGEEIATGGWFAGTRHR